MKKILVLLILLSFLVVGCKTTYVPIDNAPIDRAEIRVDFIKDNNERQAVLIEGLQLDIADLREWGRLVKEYQDGLVALNREQAQYIEQLIEELRKHGLLKEDE